jgi:hypothetical protein
LDSSARIGHVPSRELSVECNDEQSLEREFVGSGAYPGSPEQCAREANGGLCHRLGIR